MEKFLFRHKLTQSTQEEIARLLQRLKPVRG
jgi:hypothetical protein